MGKEIPKHVLNTTREVKIKNVPIGVFCPPGYDYCWQCGRVEKAEVFYEKDKCPNPVCPQPNFWND
jgi:hypothetical protein